MFYFIQIKLLPNYIEMLQISQATEVEGSQELPKDDISKGKVLLSEFD